MSRMTFALAVLALISVPCVCSAQLIAYEPFENLSNGNIVGQGSGTGWGDWEVFGTDTWVGHASASGGQVAIEDGALSYTDTDGNILNVAGAQKARATGDTGNARVFRPIAGTGLNASVSDLAGGVGNSYYISFIGKREGITDAEANGGTDPTPENPYSRNSHLSIFGQPHVLDGPLKPGEQAIIGNTFATDDFNTWNFSGVETQLDTGVEFGGSDERFVVFKVNIGGGLNGADFVEMWIDPSLTSEEVGNTTNLAKVSGNYGEEDTDTVPADGDFNNDDVVNLADYALWRNNLGAPDGTLPNDGELAGVIGTEHFDLWQANFGAVADEVVTVTPANFAQAAIGLAVGNNSSSRAPGNMIFDEIRVGTTWESVTPHAAAGGVLAGTTVPEPSSLLLGVCGAAAALWAARRRCCRASGVA
ncbi:hypothetical protein [Aeoliella sp.]|uniref:hypothetical protein n=1 Tax=Aeoliella sp. TaxID=2795800 RepID=UPI003CCC03D1